MLRQDERIACDPQQVNAIIEHPPCNIVRVSIPFDVRFELGGLVMMPMDERNVAIFVEDHSGILQKLFPSDPVALRSEFSERSDEISRTRSVDLCSPKVDFVELVELRRQSFKIEHYHIVRLRQLQRMEQCFLPGMQSLRLLENPFSQSADADHFCAAWFFQLRESILVEPVDQTLYRGDALLFECDGCSLIEFVDERHVMHLLGELPAAVPEAAARAF